MKRLFLQYEPFLSEKFRSCDFFSFYKRDTTCFNYSFNLFPVKPFCFRSKKPTVIFSVGFFLFHKTINKNK